MRVLDRWLGAGSPNRALRFLAVFGPLVAGTPIAELPQRNTQKYLRSCSCPIVDSRSLSLDFGSHSSELVAMPLTARTSTAAATKNTTMTTKSAASLISTPRRVWRFLQAGFWCLIDSENRVKEVASTSEKIG